MLIPYQQHEALFCPTMSDILDQLAGIKILLQEQAEECALRAKYDEERRAAEDKYRTETDAMEAQVRESLQKIVDEREKTQTQEKIDGEDIDLTIQLIRENHGGQMEMIQKFINDCAIFRHEQRTKLLIEISRLRQKS
ncbi:hypothetical protein MSAN_01877800 [Mycena sanguinolenta]|uniref:Uncharacterized protein n=1 Tax=Mycena sanguinolenta TaxID=230812 RepID=A0A8H7CSD0_9AGAR|nr:hypothetical protein MSAN_01877800 [Mycena sanguinolenta]